jgi:glutamyl-tRNA synthetase
MSASPRPVRTRFAPSPTGDLHVGNLRIAIFNWLFARKHGGAFVIRVEDTDLERNREGSLDGILDDLAWAGLQWDEGPDRPGAFGSCLQSERAPFHRAAAERLLADGKVYRCFCAEEERGVGTGRDGAPVRGCPGGCVDLAPAVSEARAAEGTPFTLRFPVAEGPIVVEDAVRGPVEFDGGAIGDFVILRSDGRATYNFAVVVDDIGMEITHVIRGAGHLSNTPRQALLFDALQAERPVFAHLPTVLGPDRKKLSKRDGAAGVRQLRGEGYHPDGVVNYLSLLGWAPGDDEEVFSREELSRRMALDRVGSADTMFDPAKLRWMSGQHLARMSSSALAEAARPFVDLSAFPELGGLAGDAALVWAVEAIRTRMEVFGDVNEALRVLHPGEEALRQGALLLRSEEGPFAVEVVRGVRAALEALDPETGWDPQTLGKTVREAGAGLGVRGPSLFHPVRLALSGERSGPDLGLVLRGVGRAETLRRLAEATA